MKARLIKINNSNAININRIKLKKVDTVIIGAGPSGLSAATTLTKNGKEVLLLEKENCIGGKCHTYSDPNNPENKTEWGAALIAPNYGQIINKIEEKKIACESILPADTSTIPFMKNIKNMNFLQKTELGFEFSKQMFMFTKHAQEYQRLRDAHQDLPGDYKISFYEFSKKNHLELINEFSYLFVPAFGYGLLEKCPAYAVFEYYGMTTIPEIIFGQAFFGNSFLSIKNGFQSLMEEISSQLQIKLNSIVESIVRNEQGIYIHFKSNDEFFTIAADNLILAISPLHWPKLGMDLTATEEACVNHLSYYQYPVAVVKLKGYPANHHYQFDGLTKAGLGHLALITTRDNRENPEDGRLCTAYINLPENKNDDANELINFEFTPDKIKQLENELLKVPGVTNVEILHTKIWQDYMSTLPWEDRLRLDKNQMTSATKTIYVGSYTLGGFEDVACVWAQADKTVSERMFNKKLSYDVSYYLNEIHRTTFFFTSPRETPFNGIKSVNHTNRLSL